MTELINQVDQEGREHGIWEKYHKNGTLMCRGNYRHGEFHGVWEWYYGDGSIWSMEKYRQGVNYGLRRIYSFEEPGRLHKKIYLANIK